MMIPEEDLPDTGEIPLGFGMALAQDPDAMTQFAGLSDAQRDSVLSRARSAASREEMQAIVASFRDELR